MDLYEMLLIKSPDRLKRDTEKNEARIIDVIIQHIFKILIIYKII